MIDYDEVREVKQDLELCHIDLVGSIERLSIEVENHSDLFERENQAEEADSMMKKLADATDILDDLISYLESKTEK